MQIKPGDRSKEQAGDRKALSELHDPVYMSEREPTGTSGDIARADDQKHRQDDVNQALQHRVSRLAAPFSRAYF